MEKEHKSKTKFLAPNYKIETCPSDEWRIVITGDKSYEKKYEGHQRKIHKFKELLELQRSKDAKLTDVEIIAIILYTGPMVSTFLKTRQSRIWAYTVIRC
jgi:hypothetical protein